MPVGQWGRCTSSPTGTIVRRSSSSFTESVEFSATTSCSKAGFASATSTDRFDIAAFGRNITNDESAVSGIDFNNLTAMVNEPRILGDRIGREVLTLVIKPLLR